MIRIRLLKTTVLLLLCTGLSAQKKHHFFVQLNPNIQEGMAMRQIWNDNLKSADSWGLSLDFGYEIKLSKRFTLETQIGGSLYSFLYKTNKQGVRLNMPGVNEDGTYQQIHLRGYYHSYDFIIQANYSIPIYKNKSLKTGVGIKIYSIDDLGYSMDQFYGSTANAVNYLLFDSFLHFTGGIKKPSILLSALYPISKKNDRIELGFLANFTNEPMAEGSFEIHNTYNDSHGYTKLCGCSYGISFRYKL